MAKIKYQVFVSSTYKDLLEERQEVIDILLMADCIPAGMEAFIATDDDQLNVIKKVIDLCDYYILIIGDRYGTEDVETGLSYTELEYEYAISKNIPVLVFAKEEESSIDTTSPEKNKKLKEFRDSALKNRLAKIWKDKADLSGSVALSIMNAKEQFPRPGWQRATEYDEVDTLKQIVELQLKNDYLEQKVRDLSEIVESMEQNPNLAFEDGEVTLEYSYNSGYPSRHRNHNRLKTTFKEIFDHICVDFLDAAQTEVSIRNSLTNLIRNKTGHENITLDDTQIVKKVLLQLKGLNLIKSNWSKGNRILFWGLTKKGEQVRDQTILVRK